MTRRTWSKEGVIEAIVDRQRHGLALSTIWREERSLYSAGGRLFGSWPEALHAAGIALPERKTWTRQDVIRELRSRFRRGVSRSRFWAANPELAAAAKRVFGGKRRALVCAGLCREPAQLPRKWSQEEVLDAIHARHRQGMSLQAVWREDLGLYSSAKRTFGSWTAAMRAAGIELAKTAYTNPQDVIDAIRLRHCDGLPLCGGDRAFPTLFSAARKHFGTWRAVMEAAGLASTPRRKWTRQMLIDAIQQHDRLGTLPQVWKDDKVLFGAANKHFGGWQKALAAAGRTPRRIEHWSKERIIAELRYWDGQSRHAVQLQDPSLFGAAIRFFGSVAQATEAAGVELLERRWSRQRIIDAIQDGHVKGLPIAKAGFGGVALATVAKKRFGNWREAVTAAGLAHKLPEPKAVRNWSEQSIIEAVVVRHRQGLRLSKTWKTDTGLYCAAKKHFGGWSNVLRAAGLPATRRRWSKERVVQDIQTLRQKGVPIGSLSSRDPCLTTAAIRLFGSWRGALRAAALLWPENEDVRSGLANAAVVP